MRTYVSAPAVIRVEDDRGSSAVINLHHIACVQSDPHPDRTNRAIVLLVTGDTIKINMSVDQFWDML